MNSSSNPRGTPKRFHKSREELQKRKVLLRFCRNSDAINIWENCIINGTMTASASSVIRDRISVEANGLLHSGPNVYYRGVSGDLSAPSLYKTMKALCSLGEANKDAVVTIDGKGLISYSYTGPLPQFDAEHKRKFGKKKILGTIEATNEYYHKDFLAKIKEIKGITHYLGVMGAGDQHIPLIHALQKQNKLEGIVLCDINYTQAFISALAFDSYNAAVAEGDATRFIIGQSWVTTRAPQLRAPITVQLKEADIRSEVSAVEPGAYFIYLSNILKLPLKQDKSIFQEMPSESYGSEMSWLGFSGSREVLLNIFNNPNIQDGSCILLCNKTSKEGYGVWFSSCHVVLIKQEGRFVVHSSSYESLDVADLNKYLAALADEEKFTAWFVGKQLKGTSTWGDIARDKEELKKDEELFRRIQNLEALRKGEPKS